MRRRAPMILYLFASILLFGLVFSIAWFATFFILWEFVYGDTYGGRWQHFAWPVAAVYAVGAVALFLTYVLGRAHIRLKSVLFWIFMLHVLTAAWIWLADLLFLEDLEELRRRFPHPETIRK